MLRFDPPGKGDPSPWGLIDRVEPLGPDAVVVGTPSHGGVWVRPSALTLLPEPLRQTAFSRDGWFEEDCDWCIPYLALGLHRFEADTDRAERSLAAAWRTLCSRHREFADLLGTDAALARRGAAHG